MKHEAIRVLEETQLNRCKGQDLYCPESHKDVQPWQAEGSAQQGRYMIKTTYCCWHELNMEFTVICCHKTHKNKLHLWLILQNWDKKNVKINIMIIHIETECICFSLYFFTFLSFCHCFGILFTCFYAYSLELFIHFCNFLVLIFIFCHFYDFKWERSKCKWC